jgi:putative ABC transport system ATP-binding protein
MTDLEVRGLTVEYHSGDSLVRPLDGFDLSAASGELVLLLGPSGCGKTTLLSCLAGILRPSKGQIRVGGTDVTGLEGAELTAYRRHTVGIVFQAFNLVPSLTAAENVAAPLWATGTRRRPARSRAEQLLARVDLAHRSTHRPGSLSGGQQQRVAIARALALDPPMLLADEPTAHLDYTQVESVLRIVRSIARPGRLVVVATHDERMVPLADRVVEMAPKLVGTSAGPQEIAFAAGEVVFEEGSRGSVVYVIESGEVEIVRALADGSEERLAHIVPGNYFGELGPLLGFPRAATARAVSPLVLTAYSVPDFRAWLGDSSVGDILAHRREPARR